jgi:transcriptional regulator with XRE-family HTH domain
VYTGFVREAEAQKIVQDVVGLLKIHREMLGWSQRTLASKAGVDPKTVSVIERGIRSPTLFTLSLLASAMGQPLWEVMKNANESKEITK